MYAYCFYSCSTATPAGTNVSFKMIPTLSRPYQSVRLLNLQEYQSKKLLEDYGCCIQRFIVAGNRAEAESQMNDFNRAHYMVKSQVLAGGRGKGRFIGGRKDLGGVVIANNKKEVLGYVDEMCGKVLVTKQTGKEGLLVKKVLICEAVSIKRETYLAILLDREANCPVVIHSPEGGMDIETVAREKPDLVYKEPIDIIQGMTKTQAMKIAKNLKFTGVCAERAAHEIRCLYELFTAVDATMVEINPLVESEGMQVNGAGLAMATMDIIKLYGATPANFLDVGGTVTEEAVVAAFNIITSDPKVEAILVNIFGGIVNCQLIAKGLIGAFKKLELKEKVEEGTRAKEALQDLKASGLPLITAVDLDEAAKKVVASVKK
ncbi:unnamed protein product [Anisakis simplex]|uniref:Succinate--CoA ligase (ADP-forming) n=1 Tax=Anisakis simplex TaxID=6269 RepID=A0A0M3JY41_ANISI|nr:unnamed protein product [Anisakis simplex]